MSLMTSTSNIYQKLRTAESEGDLKAQYDILKNALVTQRHIDMAELKEALTLTSQKALDAGPPLMTCILDQQNYAVIVQHKGETQATIEIPKPDGLPAYDSVDWNPAGVVDNNILSLKKSGDAVEIEIKVVKKSFPQPRYGIRLGQHFPYLNVEDYTKSLASVYMESHLFGSSAPEGTSGSPLDLTAAYRSNKIAVSDRGAGIVHLIDIDTKQISHSFQIRESGNTKRLHCTFSSDGQYLFITDNTTNQLFKFNTSSGEKEVFNVEVSICGNLMYSRQQSTIYLLGLNADDKAVSLYSCDPSSGALSHQVQLEGEAFSLHYDPGEVMTINGAGTHAIIMTSHDEPIMYTPFLSVVDLSSYEVVNTLSLDFDQKSMNLSLPNLQVFPPNTSLSQLLLDEDFIDEDAFKSALGLGEEQELGADFIAPDYSAMGGGDTPGMDVPMGGGFTAGPPKPGMKPNPEFQKLNGAKVVKHIFDVCVGQFANKEKIELNEEEHPQAVDRLKTACAKARNDLTYVPNATVKVSDIIDGLTLEVEFAQAGVMSAVKAMEQPKAKMNFTAVCQECEKPLHPSGRCFQCDPPEEGDAEAQKDAEAWRAAMTGEDFDPRTGKRIPKKKKKDAGPSIVDKMLAKKGPISKEAMRAKMQKGQGGKKLPPITFLVTDKNGNQVTLVDREKQVRWKFGGFGCPPEQKLNKPNRAERTPDATFLITDTGNNRVLEVAKDASIVRTWSKHVTEPKSAIKISTGNILVTDNQSVMEITPTDEIVWKIDGLSDPAYAVRLGSGNVIVTERGANRVQEMTPQGEVIWKFEDLNAPTQARKVRGGTMLIADTGNNRVIEVSPSGEIVWEFNGKPKGGMHILFKEPTHAIKLKAGTTVILHSGQRKALELAPDTRCLWQSSGAGLM